MATELGKAYVQIVPSAKGISGSIENALGGETDEAGKSIGSKIAGSLKRALAAAGLGKMLVDTIKEGARYEQAIGGIETLFKGSANTMKAYANQAYKTAGISANEYMEQATSFASRLLRDTGGDTAKTAELVDLAIKDMSDNANKMGTNIVDIQNAYQGLAKGNATMLDNLKIGYGGTQTEALQLAKDMGVVDASVKSFNDMSFEDAILAIHKMQEKLNVTGTTALEASTTISGSFASMKAAASNLMAQLVAGEDVKGAMSGLVESTLTFAKNLIPAIGSVFSALPEVIKTAVNEIHPALMMGLAKAIVAVKNNAPKMIENALNGLMDFSATLRKNAGQIATSGLALIKTLADSIIKNIPVFIQTVPTIISNFAGIINDNAPKIMATGLSIIKSLGIGLIKAVPVLIQNIPQILKAIWDVFMAFQWLDLGKTLITGIKNGITAMGGAMKGAGESIANGLKTVFTNGWNVIKNITSTIWNAIKSMLSGNWNSIKNLASTVWGAIKGAVTNPIQSAKSLLSSLWSGIKSAASGAWSSLKSTASSVWAGIKSAMTAPIESAKTTIRNALNKIKGFFPLSVGKIFSNLKIPKISVSGGKAPFGIGGKGSLPSFSVHWNAQGGVYDSASIVGIGVGEAGREIVTPETLMRQIVNESNDRNYAVLLRILGVLTEVADSEKTLSINHREFARLVNEVI